MRTDLELHDATLEKLSLDWGVGSAEVSLKTAGGIVLVRASGVTKLLCPRLYPWGPSSSVNQVRGPRALGGASILEIEMQSGDVIVLEAASFIVDDRLGSPPCPTEAP
jgi:hypothetical protein